MNTPRIETERLILRKFTPADIDALYALLKDEQVNAFLPWFPVKTRDEAVEFYETRYAAHYQRARGYDYAVCRKEDDCPIGYVHVNMADSYDLGYALHRAFWHQGITTEAAGAVIAQMKRDGIAYVTATHDVHNPRSGAVMKRLGMKYQYTYEERVQPKDVLVTFRMYQLNLDGAQERVYTRYWENAAVRWIETDV